MKHRGWIVNDCLTPILGVRMLWENLLDWFPDLEFPTGKYVIYDELPDVIEDMWWSAAEKPAYLIRNATYFRKLDIPVPTISLLQDITLEGWLWWPHQRAILRGSRFAVFNSDYTHSFYEDLDLDYRIIPLGTDVDHFRPLDKEECRQKHDILPDSILWVGAAIPIKGYSFVQKLIEGSEYNFCLVSKDRVVEMDYKDHPRVRVFTRAPMSQTVEIFNACRIVICTSNLESQHLASIEAAACGLPVVTSPVGIWHNMPGEDWGVRAHDGDEFTAAMESMMAAPEKYSPREFILKSNLTNQACQTSWKSILDIMKEEYEREHRAQA